MRAIPAAKCQSDAAGIKRGYRSRVCNRLEAWFVSHPHLELAAEKRVQAAWRESFLAPLAALCSSSDLLKTGATK